MGSSLLDQMGQMHIVTGLITATDATDAALTSNDGSATLTRVAAGEYTVTFGDVFLSAPHAVGTAVQALGTATVSTDSVVILIESVATNAVTFNCVDVVGGTDATQGAQSDAGNIEFIVVGQRNN